MKTMYVYILKCSDESYYVGVTNNMEKRLLEHEEGVIKSCYTYDKRPVKLMFYQMFDNPKSAIVFEKKVKKWTRAKKEALIQNNWEQLQKLSECKNESHFKNFNKQTASTTLSLT